MRRGGGIALKLSAAADRSVSEALQAARDGETWTAAAREWHRLYAPFVPRDTGALAERVRFGPGRILHVMPYARAVYEGRGARRSGSPQAAPRWDRAAAPSALPVLERFLQARFDARKG